MDRFERALYALAKILSRAGMLLLLAFAVSTLFDGALRWLFGRPLDIVRDLWASGGKGAAAGKSVVGAEETMDAQTAMAVSKPQLTYCGGAKCQILSTGSEIVAVTRDVNVLIETPPTQLG